MGGGWAWELLHVTPGVVLGWGRARARGCPGAATVGSDHAWMIVTGWGSSGVRGTAPRDFLGDTARKIWAKSSECTDLHDFALKCHDARLPGNLVKAGFRCSWARRDFVAPGPSQLSKAGFRCSRTQPAEQGRISLLPDPASWARQDFVTPGPSHLGKASGNLPCFPCTEVGPGPMKLSCPAQVSGPGATKPCLAKGGRGCGSRSNERRNLPAHRYHKASCT